MSKHRLRHFAIALILGAAPLISVVPSQASASAPIQSAAAAVPTSFKPESAALQKFRDIAPPVMEQVAKIEATAAPSKAAPPRVSQTQIAQTATNPRLFREVFGFAFASSLGDPTIGYPSWNFGLLSTVAYFGVHVSWTGDLSNDSGLTIWNDPNGPVPGLIQTAHANGTKVVLTIEMFDSTNGTPNMCSALQRSALTIQRTVAQVNARGIDGVNVDYESNNTQCTDPSTHAVQSSQSMFTNFVKNLRAALPAGSYLSVDTYSGAAGFRDNSGAYLGFFDIGALNNYVDSFFVMAYDMEYSNWGSSPLSCPTFCIGPTAPLTTYLFNDTRASNEYTAVVPASKVIMGIPYYGRKECVGGYTPTSAPANAVGSTIAVADGYLDASTENGYVNNTDYHIHRETRDAQGGTRWDTFTSSTAQCTRELYWDDVTALGNKYNLIINNHLRGAGIFALNYGGGAPELWSLINLKFGQCSEAAIAADKTVPQIPGTSITFTGSALCAGTATYRFWMQPPGGAFSVMRDYTTANTWSWDTTNQALGTYTFQVDARNQGSSGLDTYARMSFRLALCATPTFSPNPASPQLPGTVVTFTAAGSCQGTPEYRFWRTPPGGVKTQVQDYSSAATLTWTTTSQDAYGAYGFAVDVRVLGTAVTAEASQTLTYSLTSCTGVALTANKSSPQPTGNPVGLSGSATCVGTPQYRFMILPPAGTWTVLQDFNSTNTFTWSAGGPGGTYSLELDAKGAAADVTTIDTAQVAFDLSSCTGVTLATSPSSPQTPGTSVTLSGTATCPSTAQYRFSITAPNAGSTVVQNYGGASTYSWNTSGLALGDYGLRVDVRNVGATGSSEAMAGAVYTVANAACTVPVLSSDLASPQGAGAVVTFSATTTTCPSPLYKFWIQTTTAAWTVVQDYSMSRSFSWQTTGAPGGHYRVEVDVRDSSRPVPYDQFAVVPYVINSCTGVTLSPNVAAPQQVGAQITLTASTSMSACANPLYEFWTLAPGSSAWQLVQGYSTSSVFNWNTAVTAAGAYQLGVWSRDASSAATYDSYTSLAYMLTIPHCTSVTASAAPPSPSGSGTAVTITASAPGCTAPLYEFWMRASGSSQWQLIQGYTSSADYHWNSTGALAGTEVFGVWARDARSPAAYDTYFSVPYTVTVPSCPSVTATAAPTSVGHGTGDHVTITGAAAGCTNANPSYEFWMRPAGSSTWILVQGYSASSTYDWNSKGALAGTEYFGVWARDSNSSARYDAINSTPVAVT